MRGACGRRLEQRVPAIRQVASVGGRVRVHAREHRLRLRRLVRDVTQHVFRPQPREEHRLLDSRRVGRDARAGRPQAGCRSRICRLRDARATARRLKRPAVVGTLDAVRLTVDAPLTERSEPVRASVVHHDPLAAVVTVDDVTLPKEANWGGSIGIKLVGACKGHPRAWESRSGIQSSKVGSEGRSGRGGAGDGCNTMRQRWTEHGAIDEESGKGGQKC